MLVVGVVVGPECIAAALAVIFVVIGAGIVPAMGVGVVVLGIWLLVVGCGIGSPVHLAMFGHYGRLALRLLTDCIQ